MATYDISQIQLPNGDICNLKDSNRPTKTSDLTNDSGFITGMVILSYGSSTWQDFMTAYRADRVVYCRASSNSNPASGSQTRMAFMAYVNNETNPTEVEFQYYRSVSSHSENQQGDQVYVYKLNSSSSWSVTVREASSKVAAGTGLTRSYSSGTVTLGLSSTIPTKTSDLTNDSNFITLTDIPAASSSQDGLLSSTDKAKIDTLDGSLYALKQDTVLDSSLTLGVRSLSQTTVGSFSASFGFGNVASGRTSFAVGSNHSVTADSGAAFGASNTVSGRNSMALGWYTAALGENQLVFGRFNDLNDSAVVAEDYVEIVGNGTSSARSHARTLDWSGNETLAGRLTLGGDPLNNMHAVTLQYLENSMARLGFFGESINEEASDFIQLPETPSVGGVMVVKLAYPTLGQDFLTIGTNHTTVLGSQTLWNRSIYNNDGTRAKMIFPANAILEIAMIGGYAYIINLPTVV